MAIALSARARSTQATEGTARITLENGASIRIDGEHGNVIYIVPARRKPNEGEP